MPDHSTPPTTRRDFFARTSDGLLGAALTQLLCHEYFGGTSALGADLEAAAHVAEPANNLKPRQGHHAAKASSVIQLFMNGGPSQMDLFDPKPFLDGLEFLFCRVVTYLKQPSKTPMFCPNLLAQAR